MTARYDAFANDTLPGAMDYASPDIPPEYRSTIEEAAPGIGVAVDQAKIPGEDWTQTLQRVLPALVATWQQRQILGIQLERAKQGLPPLDAAQYGMGVNVGLSPDTTRTLVIAAVAVGAALYLTRKNAK